MLACARLCNDAELAHALAQHHLPQGVVDFVGPRVVEVLSLQVDLRPATVGPAQRNLQFNRKWLISIPSVWWVLSRVRKWHRVLVTISGSRFVKYSRLGRRFSVSLSDVIL